MKADNTKLTKEFLSERYERARKHGYDQKAKWIEFSEYLIDKGYTLYLYEARQTFSKYITIRKHGYSPFKVRFSNHKPIQYRELNGDCDFFVGVTNLSVTTTKDAIYAVEKHFNG